MPAEVFLCAIVIVAAASDLASRRIPNIVSLSGLGIALVLQLAAPHGSALAWLGGALAGLLLFLPFYLLRGMAAGDVKLMAAVGSFVGPLSALKIGLAAFLIGALMGCAIVIFTGRLAACAANLRALLGALGSRPSALVSNEAPPIASVGGIPYAVAIALATLAFLSWQRW